MPFYGMPYNAHKRRARDTRSHGEYTIQGWRLASLKILEQKFYSRREGACGSPLAPSLLAGLALYREELRHFQRQADIARDFEHAAKEGALRVKFAVRHFQPVLVG
jgi:hypothetical protein